MTPTPRRHRSGRGGPRRSGRGAAGARPKPAELNPSLDVPDVERFDAFPLDPGVLQGIRNMDIEKPTPIQALSIQPILDGRDLIAKAETGTGKTLAFGAPIVSRVDPERASVLALVLCPTRELAQQVAGVLAALGAPRGLRVALVVGGDPMHPQVEELRRGAQIVVGTPGRVLDLYTQRFLSFPWTEYAVLDEADKMFEIGFLDDVRKILSLLPEERQTLLFSATYPDEVLGLAREFTRDPVEVATARGLATVDAIEQTFMSFEHEGDRALALVRMIERGADDDVFLVFLDRRTDVDRLLRRLERESFTVKALHGGYDQASRFRVMSAFRSGEVKALLATDVASRGLDVEHVTHVINYSVPREVESYTHRIGRTGRAGRAGRAVTFVEPGDRRRWSAIQRAINWDVREEEPPGSAPRDRGPRRPRRDEPERRRSDEGARAERGRRERSRAEAPPREERSGREARGDRGGSRERRGSQGGRDSRDRTDAPERAPRGGEREAPPFGTIEGSGGSSPRRRPRRRGRSGT